jgi:hypothetical protein
VPDGELIGGALRPEQSGVGGLSFRQLWGTCFTPPARVALGIAAGVEGGSHALGLISRCAEPRGRNELAADLVLS